MTSAIELRVRLPLASFALDVEVASSARSLGIFGASGAGKTSLLEAVAGWRTPAEGRVRFGDATLFDGAAGIDVAIERRGVGYVPQEALLFPHWTVERNVRAGARRDASEDDALVARTVAVLEIEHLMQRRATHLSGGERQRVALARAIASRPRVLLLDEPLGALDLPLRRRILPYLLRVKHEFALPTLLVSHDATEVQAVCDEALVLDAGRVRAQGPPSEVLRDVRAGERAFDNVLAGVVECLSAGIAAVRLDAGGTIEVPSSGLAEGGRALVALGADEILVALDAPTRISARNVLPARVERVEDAIDGATRVDARLAEGRGAGVSIAVTRSSATELDLRAGLAVHLVFKTSACRVLSAAR